MTTGAEAATGGRWGADGWAVNPGDGLPLEMGPHRLEVLLRGADVDGALGVFIFKHEAIPDNPPHAHLHFAKVLYVLEGRYDFRVGDATFSGGPGALVVVPKAAHHAFTTATGGRILFVCAPSGNEEMFLEMGELGPTASEEQLASISERFGMVSPPGDDARPWRPDRDGAP